MQPRRIVTENSLDEWVRGHEETAQGIIVELAYYLVAASCPGDKRRFPLGDSIGQQGPDGILESSSGYHHFVPVGRSVWEIGTGTKPQQKATDDYNTRTADTPADVRLETTFIFATPLSGRRGWPHTDKKGGQGYWIRERQRRQEWRDVRILDGTLLVDWLQSFPAVEMWLAGIMGMPVDQIETLDHRWEALKCIGEPPPLLPSLFLSNREQACDRLRSLFAGSTPHIRLDTHYPDQVADFVAAYARTMNDDAGIEARSRSLIVKHKDSWNALVALSESHVLVADFDLDETTSEAPRLIANATRARHCVIIRGSPGGRTTSDRMQLPDPKVYQIEESLKLAGYREERARQLALKSNGHLGSLLGYVQDLSWTPEWAQDTNAADLAIAEMLGSWREHSESDKSVVRDLSGKEFGEWIGRMREIARQPGTPLRHREGFWKFVLRYEGWFALGSLISGDLLVRFKQVALLVLGERDPKFDLPPDKRYMSSVYGKEMQHSPQLRKGIAETLALIGSHPVALSSCAIKDPRSIANVIVSELLQGADWRLWASLSDDVLPLLAEAAPDEFLNAVQEALASDPCSFDSVIAQESAGITGQNYLTGLLWALESLAWDGEYLIRVILVLGELANRDPGGNWANRPHESIIDILLPWLPQTCAPVLKRKAAMETLLRESPESGWKVLLELLPGSRQSSSGTYKPTWRESIDPDWSHRVEGAEYDEQISIYADLAVAEAIKDATKLIEIVDMLGALPAIALEQILAHMTSDIVSSVPDEERFQVWNRLSSVVSKHRRYFDAPWAMDSESLAKVATVTDRWEPADEIDCFRRLFNEYDGDLYDEHGKYEEQTKELDRRRLEAMERVYKSRGIGGVISFAESVKHPANVGMALGYSDVKAADADILPSLLTSTEPSTVQFLGGFIRARTRMAGFEWVDSTVSPDWSVEEKWIFLCNLRFEDETWERVARIMGEDLSLY